MDPDQDQATNRGGGPAKSQAAPGRDRATGFSTRQVNALRRSLNRQFVRTRKVEGRELSYIEGWHAIAEANRIFGFERWDRETVETKCLLARENRGSLHTVYIAKVRITVRAEGETVIREGYGTGESLGGGTVGEAHERSLKMAETDATKRALATFGKPFGLGLYLSPRRTAERPRPGHDPNAATPIPDHARRRTLQRLGPNGRYHVPARSRPPIDPSLQSSMPHDEGEKPSTVLAKTDHAAAQSGVHPYGTSDQSSETVETGPTVQVGGPAPDPAKGQVTTVVETPTPTSVPQVVQLPAHEPGRLLIERTMRRREPAHLRFVASQPCLICGRTPSDAHHLKFAQPRALGRKVSDEFTVPLCRVHHRQLHHSGSEVRWWEAMVGDVDPLKIAKGLWEESRAEQRSVEAVAPGVISAS
jgi:hypothetical protein